MAGLIPLSGFWAKDEILVGLYHGPINQGALVLVLISLPITALYMTRVVLLTFFGEPKDHHVYEHAHESPPSMTVPIAILVRADGRRRIRHLRGRRRGAGLPQRLARLRLQPGRRAGGVPRRLVAVDLLGRQLSAASIAAGVLDLGRRGGAVEARGCVLAVPLPAVPQPLLHRRAVPVRSSTRSCWPADRRSPGSTARSSTTPASTAPARRRTSPGCSRSTSRPARSRTTRWHRHRRRRHRDRRVRIQDVGCNLATG